MQWLAEANLHLARDRPDAGCGNGPGHGLVEQCRNNPTMYDMFIALVHREGSKDGTNSVSPWCEAQVQPLRIGCAAAKATVVRADLQRSNVVIWSSHVSKSRIEH